VPAVHCTVVDLRLRRSERARRGPRKRRGDLTGLRPTRRQSTRASLVAGSVSNPGGVLFKIGNQLHKQAAVNALVRAKIDRRTGTTTGTSVSEEDPAATPQGEPTSRVLGGKREWRRPGSNRGPRDYESVHARSGRGRLDADYSAETLAAQGLRQGTCCGGFSRFLQCSSGTKNSTRSSTALRTCPVWHGRRVAGRLEAMRTLWLPVTTALALPLSAHGPVAAGW
jgi:hypothetical protein